MLLQYSSKRKKGRVPAGTRPFILANLLPVCRRRLVVQRWHPETSPSGTRAGTSAIGDSGRQHHIGYGRGDLNCRPRRLRRLHEVIEVGQGCKRNLPTSAAAVKRVRQALIGPLLRRPQVAARQRVVAFARGCDNAVAMPVQRDSEVHVPGADDRYRRHRHV